MTVQAKSITAEEFFEMGEIERCELVRGEVVYMAPAGAEHGDIAGELFGRIWSFVREHKLGKVYAAETGFIVARNPDITRGADIAFVRQERIPPGRIKGYFPAAPDLAVEVVSPTDRLADVLEKVDEWLHAGATSVWIVTPRTQSIEVYRANNQVFRYRSTDEIGDEPALPGFNLQVNSLFSSSDSP